MKNPFWTLLLLAIPALPVHPACPAKITVKECPEYASATDNTYLKVRIVLDGASEVLVPKGQKSSLRIWTEDMLAKYDLRAWSNPDSAYKTRY
ncbi:MAG: hypothetical protein JWP91_3743, partial [Fibrobacteres bacterium]|nr:hypothetical protein [Fibrobacterota bacterium]